MNTHDTQPHDTRAPRWKPSVTVAAVIEREGRYLLVEEHTRAGLRLNTPAGHLEPGETPQQGAVREALDALGSADGEEERWQDGEAGWGA